MANANTAQRNHDLVIKTLSGAIGVGIGGLTGTPLAEALSIAGTGIAAWGFAVLTGLIFSGVAAAWLSHQRDMRAVHQTATPRR